MIRSYPCVRAYMALRGVNMIWLAEKAGIPYETLRKKLRGKSEFTLPEALRVRRALDCGAPLETLFEREGGGDMEEKT